MIKIDITPSFVSSTGSELRMNGEGMADYLRAKR
jgi:hypothetical protein